MTTSVPTNTDDTIDSRDIIERIEELTSGGTHDSDVEELTALVSLRAEGEDCAEDWDHGETLIRASHFKEYAQELAEDCGMINACAKWPNTCIDWDQAARELQMDYTSVDFDGVTYWVC